MKFDLLYSPKYPSERVEVEVEPKDWHMYHGLHTLSTFLLNIDDYDLVRRVCQVKDDDYEHKGIGSLSHLPNVPRGYPGGEAYQLFLSHIEKLVHLYMQARSPYGSFYVESQVWFTEGTYHQEMRRERKHPYSFLLYALAILPLGQAGYSLASEYLSVSRDIERDCPTLGWVYSQVRLAYLSSYEYGEKNA